MGKAKVSSQARRTLILWALLVKDNGAAFQNSLKPEPGKADRVALEREGLITVRKIGQRLFLEVTDKGWQWAGEHLTAELPATAPAAAKIFEAWLGRLQAFLAARQLVLADVLGPQTPPQAAPLWDRLRQAYLEATGGALNTRALLKDIRPRLCDISPQAFDGALKELQAQAKLQLYPIDNRREITEADKAAAVMIGGEPRHILWIEK